MFLIITEVYCWCKDGRGWGQMTIKCGMGRGCERKLRLWLGVGTGQGQTFVPVQLSSCNSSCVRPMDRKLWRMETPRGWATSAQLAIKFPAACRSTHICTHDSAESSVIRYFSSSYACFSSADLGL